MHYKSFVHYTRYIYNLYMVITPYMVYSIYMLRKLRHMILVLFDYWAWVLALGINWKFRKKLFKP